MKYVTGFFRFWYDFIVGDSWVLAAGGAVVLTLAYALVEADLMGAAQLALPAVAMGTVAASLLRRQ